MEIRRNSPYLPKNKIRNYITGIKRKVAYRVWKRKLKKYGNFNKQSVFKLLEVGCGPGYFLQCAEKWFPNSEMYGLDLDESLIQFASSHLRRASLITHDGQNLPFPDETLDLVCSLQVVEHLEKPEEFFLEAYRIVKRNGHLIIATPNPAGIPAKILGKKWQGHRFDHISLKTPQEWSNIIHKSGFKILDDGSTGLTGIKILQIFPFALINWIPMAIFGYFPWYKGESYMVIAKKM
ncbi:MAG: class I SAM-dependent methyltransferase [Nitrospirota bacterium]